jgi:hypothetical protein
VVSEADSEHHPNEYIWSLHGGITCWIGLGGTSEQRLELRHLVLNSDLSRPLCPLVLRSPLLSRSKPPHHHTCPRSYPGLPAAIHTSGCAPLASPWMACCCCCCCCCRPWSADSCSRQRTNASVRSQCTSWKSLNFSNCAIPQTTPHYHHEAALASPNCFCRALTCSANHSLSPCSSSSSMALDISRSRAKKSVSPDLRTTARSIS